MGGSTGCFVLRVTAVAFVVVILVLPLILVLILILALGLVPVALVVVPTLVVVIVVLTMVVLVTAVEVVVLIMAWVVVVVVVKMEVFFAFMPLLVDLVCGNKIHCGFWGISLIFVGSLWGIFDPICVVCTIDLAVVFVWGGVNSALLVVFVWDSANSCSRSSPTLVVNRGLVFLNTVVLFDDDVIFSRIIFIPMVDGLCDRRKGEVLISKPLIVDKDINGKVDALLAATVDTLLGVCVSEAAAFSLVFFEYFDGPSLLSMAVSVVFKAFVVFRFIPSVLLFANFVAVFCSIWPGADSVAAMLDLKEVTVVVNLRLTVDNAVTLCGCDELFVAADPSRPRLDVATSSSLLPVVVLLRALRVLTCFIWSSKSLRLTVGVLPEKVSWCGSRICFGNTFIDCNTFVFCPLNRLLSCEFALGGTFLHLCIFETFIWREPSDKLSLLHFQQARKFERTFQNKCNIRLSGQGLHFFRISDWDASDWSMHFLSMRVLLRNGTRQGGHLDFAAERRQGSWRLHGVSAGGTNPGQPLSKQILCHSITGSRPFALVRHLHQHACDQFSMEFTVLLFRYWYRWRRSA